LVLGIAAHLLGERALLARAGPLRRGRGELGVHLRVRLMLGGKRLDVLTIDAGACLPGVGRATRLVARMHDPLVEARPRQRSNGAG
jgi:hypothetical protein